MSETTIPFVCHYCGQATTNANDVLPRFEEGNGFECISQDACKRRQKRDQIIAEMTEKAMKPKRNRTNDALLAIVLSCGIFLGGSTAVAISWLISQSGF